jgi:hypothetical protein
MNKQFGVSCFHPSPFRLHPCTRWSELESNQPFGLFRPALIRLSYPTVREGHKFSGPPFLLGMHLFHDVTIIVYIHEEVLAPLSARLGVVAKHYPL